MTYFIRDKIFHTFTQKTQEKIFLIKKTEEIVDLINFFPIICPLLHCPGESIGLKFIPSQSALFRLISIFVSKPMRIIRNQSEKPFCISFDEKRSKVKPA